MCTDGKPCPAPEGTMHESEVDPVIVKSVSDALKGVISLAQSSGKDGMSVLATRMIDFVGGVVMAGEPTETKKLIVRRIAEQCAQAEAKLAVLQALEGIEDNPAKALEKLLALVKGAAPKSELAKAVKTVTENDGTEGDDTVQVGMLTPDGKTVTVDDPVKVKELLDMLQSVTGHEVPAHIQAAVDKAAAAAGPRIH
jgi:hypothetical protein